MDNHTHGLNALGTITLAGNILDRNTYVNQFQKVTCNSQSSMFGGGRITKYLRNFECSLFSEAFVFKATWFLIQHYFYSFHDWTQLTLAEMFGKEVFELKQLLLV